MVNVISSATTVGKVLFGGESNSYYAEAGQRLIIVEVQENKYGEFRTVAFTGRWIESLNHAVKDRGVFDSGPLATEAEAREIANTVYALGRDKFTGQMTPTVPSSEKVYGFDMPDSHHTSVCPKCDRFNSLKTTQEAYGDRTDCECGYNSWYSIGD